MLVKRVKKTNMYDVFMGNGWNSHSRVAMLGNKLKLLSGNKLQAYQVVEFFKEVKQ